MLFNSFVFSYFRGFVSALGTLKFEKCTGFQQVTVHFFFLCVYSICIPYRSKDLRYNNCSNEHSKTNNESYR